MNSFKRVTTVLLLICMLCSMVQAFAAETDSNNEITEHVVTIQYNGTNDYPKAYEVLEIVNQRRAEEGLPPLAMDEELMEAAMQRAAECAVYYSHTRPDGSTCYTAFPSKFAYGYCGENVAVGYTSASHVMEGWMNSEGHKANIMSENYNTIGIGCFYQDGAIYWSQLFTSEAAAKPSKEPKVENVTVTADLLPSNLDIYFSTDEVIYGHKYHLYNMNTQYPYSNGVIEFIGDHIHYISSDRHILNITDHGIIRMANAGTVTLSAYIDDMLVHAEELTLEGYEHIHGDANHDHQLSNSDVVIVCKYLINYDVEIDLDMADANDDGRISNIDVIKIARSLLLVNNS